MHRRKRAQHVSVLDEVVIFLAADGVTGVQAQRVGRSLGLQDSLEPGQPAELSDKTTARFKPALGVTGKIDGQVQ